MKKIAYISGTRADFGLMVPVLKAINSSPLLELQVYAAGIHLMPKFGNTIDHVRKEFSDCRIIEAIFETDDRLGMAAFIGEFTTKLVYRLSIDKPDFVLTLGDRPEMLCVASACLYLGIPTGQIHGGEKTSTVDELARHAITKLSQLHFPATEESAKRIEKMGEERWRINVVGAPALDTILNEELPTREKLSKELGFDEKQRFILVTQHPVSAEIEYAGEQIEKTLNAVKRFNLQVIVTYPHADAGGVKIIEVIDREKDNPLFHLFPSLEHRQFLALEREASVWVGNSSGALIESSSFKVPVINIGTRQLGRQRGDNVIDVGYGEEEIAAAIHKSLYDKNYLAYLRGIKNPWGDGQTGPRVAKILEDTSIDSKLLTKQITY